MMDKLHEECGRSVCLLHGLRGTRRAQVTRYHLTNTRKKTYRFRVTGRDLKQIAREYLGQVLCIGTIDRIRYGHQMI